MGNTEKDIQDFLKKVSDILEDEKKYLERGDHFNVFDTLVYSDEKKHSAFIAMLLDPQESHGQKDKFLKMFLAVVGDTTEINTKTSEVYTEFPIDNNEGRIDIFIEDKKGKKAIAIENKIWAKDQPKQLKRYDTFLKNNYEIYALYYLTLDGKEASEYSTGKIPPQYKCISYTKNIRGWINKCIEKSSGAPRIEKSLEQYNELINELTGKEMKNKKILDVMAKNAELVAKICDAKTQEEYKKYVYESYMKNNLEKFCEKNDLIFDDNTMYYENDAFCGLEKTDTGFYFKKTKWELGLWLYNDDNKMLKFGISSTTGGKNKQKKKKLRCFTFPPDDDFPYGYDKLPLWNLDTYTNMKNGVYVTVITDKVNDVLKEIEKENISI